MLGAYKKYPQTYLLYVEDCYQQQHFAFSKTLLLVPRRNDVRIKMVRPCTIFICEYFCKYSLKVFLTDIRVRSAIELADHRCTSVDERRRKYPPLFKSIAKTVSVSYSKTARSGVPVLKNFLAYLKTGKVKSIFTQEIEAMIQTLKINIGK